MANKLANILQETTLLFPNIAIKNKIRKYLHKKPIYRPGINILHEHMTVL